MPVHKTYGAPIVGENYDQIGFGAAHSLKNIRLALANPLRDHLLTVPRSGGGAGL